MKKAQNLFQDVEGLLLEDFGAISISFDKSRKPMTLIWISHELIKFPFSYLCRDSQQSK